MGIETTDESLDAVPEIEEIEEIYGDSSQDPPEMPEIEVLSDAGKIETIEGEASAEEFLELEVEKAQEAVGFVDEALASARDAVGNDASFVRMETAIEELEGNLKLISLDELESVEGGDKNDYLERAGDIVNNPDVKAGSIEEIRELIDELEAGRNEKFEDDDVFNSALKIYARQLAYWQGDESARPADAEMRKADEVWDSTARGRLSKALLYLKDYEAVATGVFEPFQKVSPEMLRELDAKSQHIWAIESTGRFELSATDSKDIVIGEQHLRLVNLPEYQAQFDDYLAQLNEGDVVVVEHDSDPSKNAWTILSAEKRFMQQAQEFAGDPAKSLELEILDDNAEGAFTVWEDAGAGHIIGKENFNYMAGLFLASQNLFAPGGVEQVIDSINNDEKLDEIGKRAKLQGVERLANLLIQEGIESSATVEVLNKAKLLYIRIDSLCRERRYQEILARLRQRHKGAKIFAVVGESHREGLHHTLEDSDYRTEIDAKSVEELNELVGDLK